MTNRASRSLNKQIVIVSRETAKIILIYCIKLFQMVSKVTPQRCKYHPSCSNYAITAIKIHGAGKGSMLSTLRILRCNPWSNGGIDEVPALERKIDWRHFGSSRGKQDLC